MAGVVGGAEHGFDIIPGLIGGGRLLFPQMFLVVVPMVLAILALRRASRAPAVPAAMSVLLHPLCIVAAYLWFTHHRYIHHVVAWLPQEPEFMQFLPGLLVTSFLPVAGAVLVFRRDSRQSAPEPAVSELPSPVG